MTTTETLMHSGIAIPRIGFGTWPLTGDEARDITRTALQLGYRLVDTAENYGNEDAVGQGVRDSGLPRDEVFVTTKINREWHGVAEVTEGLRGCLERLGMDYVDLLLIHWPNPDQDRYVEAWKGMIKAREAGLVRAIGVSNFKPAHLDRIIDATGEVPDINQIQLSPLSTRDEERKYHDEHGILTESWSPLGKNTDLLERDVVTTIAQRHGKTPAQVVLRWHLDLGLIPIPKSANPERLAANLDVYGWRLAPEEVAALSQLDHGTADITDSDEFGH